MFRTTTHKTLRIPHSIALIAGLLALSSWAWTSQHVHSQQHAMNNHDDTPSATVKNSGKALLDIGVLLLLKGTRG